MINLHAKFANNLPEFFGKNSIIAGRLSNRYSFTGVATVKLTIPQTVPLTDYRRSGTNRYGDPQEIQDTVQELTLSRDRSFALTVDKGNNTEQGMLKSAGRILKLQMQQRCIPESDKYTMERLAMLGGNIVAITSAPTKTTIADLVSDGTAALDDAEVPEENRTLYVTPDIYKLLKHSPLYVDNNTLGKRAVLKGQVGEYDNMPVIKVSAKRFPENVYFLIVHKDSACAPQTISETKLHKDPPGISGNLMEGRFRYDCFVFEPTACGIYVAVNATAGHGTVCKAPTVDAFTGAITPEAGGTAWYTTDGSDPRYSASAQSGTEPDVKAGDTLRVYCKKAGAFPSPVVTVTVAAAAGQA